MAFERANAADAEAAAALARAHIADARAAAATARAKRSDFRADAADCDAEMSRERAATAEAESAVMRDAAEEQERMRRDAEAREEALKCTLRATREGLGEAWVDDRSCGCSLCLAAASTGRFGSLPLPSLPTFLGENRTAGAQRRGEGEDDSAEGGYNSAATTPRREADARRRRRAAVVVRPIGCGDRGVVRFRRVARAVWKSVKQRRIRGDSVAAAATVACRWSSVLEPASHWSAGNNSAPTDLSAEAAAAALGAAEEIRGALAAAREALQRTKRDRAQRTL
jgi:hypothetical protein